MAQRSRFFDSTGVAVTMAVSAAADDILDTAAPHGFVAGEAVHFTALTGGAGLVVGTIYFVVATSLGSTTFRVSAAAGGAPLGFTTDITAGTVVGGDRIYSADAFAQVLASIAGDGVVDGKGLELVVTEDSPPVMGVHLGDGIAFVQGRYFEVYGGIGEDLAVTAAHATLNRIDRVVVRADLAGRTALLAVKAGTPAGSPVAPALTQTPGGTWEISLAQVLVPAVSTTVITARITDERTFASSPFVSVLLDLTTGHRHDGAAGGRKVLGSDLSGAIADAGHGARTVANAHQHSQIGGVGADDHHPQAHAIGGADHTGSLTDALHGVRALANAHAHANLSGIGTDDHHARTHTHASAGAQGGTITHAATTGRTANDHHAQLHAASHVYGGPDSLDPTSINAWRMGSMGGGAQGQIIWVGTTDPAGVSIEGDIWVRG